MKRKDQGDAAIEADTTRRGARLSLPLNEDGTIDWESVRPSNKERFAEIVSNDAVALEAIGLAAGGEGEEGEGENPLSGITETNIGTALDIICQANALAFKVIAEKTQKHPFLVDAVTRKPMPLIIDQDILQKSFTLTEEQHKELDPRVLLEVERHSHQMPEWVKKNLNIIMLFGMFFKYQLVNGLTAIQVQKLRDAERLKTARAKTQQPIDSDAAPAHSEEGNGLADFPHRSPHRVSNDPGISAP